MIRTRDFCMYAAVVAVAAAAVTATFANERWVGAAEPAAAIKFSDTRSEIAGATSEQSGSDRDATIARLRTKIANGEGESAYGAPVFTSVDTIIATDTPVVTDATLLESVLIGYTLDGAPLQSDESWRFVGFGPDERVGTALNGTPIFGAREDTIGLDACGGASDSSGYRLYLRPGDELRPACFTK